MKMKTKAKNEYKNNNKNMRIKHKLPLEDSNSNLLNKSNSSSFNLSMNKSSFRNSSNRSNPNKNNIIKNNKKSKNNIQNKDKSKSKSKSRDSKSTKNDNDLIKKQYKIIKDFLQPIIKEENARQLVSCYTKKMSVEKSPILKRKKYLSMNNRSILDYSFVTNNSKKKIKYPLFQIMFPNQYKKHLEDNNKQKKNIVKRPCRHMSAPNIDLPKNMIKTNNKENNIKKSIKGRNYKRSNVIKGNSSNKNKNSMDIINNKTINHTVNKNNNDIINNNNNNNINKIKYSKSISSNTNTISRPKTPPLYLRLDEVEKKHKEEIEKLKKKFDNNHKLNKSFNESSKSRNKSMANYNFERWYNYEKTWQKIKDMKLNIIRSELEENETFMKQNGKNEETFKPKINENSQLLVNQKYDGDFYSRLKNFVENKNKKVRKLEKKLRPTFKPYINTNYKISNDYYNNMKFNQRLINSDFIFFLEQH